ALKIFRSHLTDIGELQDADVPTASRLCKCRLITVTPLNNSQSRVDMRAEISLLPVFGLMMGPIMRMQMGGILTNATEELKYFAEEGVPHPRKLEADRKHQFIAA
ncbi:MAG: hypothetical protein AAF978_06780, partial [Cyanobacteria bacterium P01_E01_bin.48]